MFNKDTLLANIDSIKPEMFNRDRQSKFWHVLNVIREYYDQNEEKLSLEACKLIHHTKLRGANEKERERILGAYEELADVEVGEEVEAIFKQFKTTNLVFDIQQALDDDDMEEYDKLTAEFDILRTGGSMKDNLFTSMSLQEIVEQDDSDGMTWWLEGMREFCPKLTRGTGTLVVARSNAGKTSFLCPEAIHLMRQGFDVIHCALSEDGEEELLIRYIQAAYNVTEDVIMQHLGRFDEKFKEDFGENLRILNTGTMHISEIEKRVKAFTPDLLVVDQYQKVLTKVNQSANTAEQRTKSAEAIKDLSKKYNFHYLCATQADKDAGWVVTDLNIDNAKTGVVGDFKVIIGLGKQDDDRYRSIDIKGKTHRALSRNVNIAKNKGKMGAFTTYLFPETCEWR